MWNAKHMEELTLILKPIKYWATFHHFEGKKKVLNIGKLKHYLIGKIKEHHKVLLSLSSSLSPIPKISLTFSTMFEIPPWGNSFSLRFDSYCYNVRKTSTVTNTVDK